MKKIIVIFIGLILLSSWIDLAVAGNTIFLEGEDLVIYVPPAPPEEIQRYANPFDSSVSADEIAPEIAIQLLKGEIEQYSPEENRATEIRKLLFWHLPLQCEATDLSWVFKLNENGKISKIQSSKTETRTILWSLDFICRALPIALLFSGIFFASDTLSRREIIAQCVILVVITTSIILISELHTENGIFIPLLLCLLIPIFFNWMSSSAIILTGFVNLLTISICGWKNSATIEYTGLMIAIVVLSFLTRRYCDKKFPRKDEGDAFENLPASE
ncbi:MAG TPA: hypothetical protein DEA46_01990 [Candidatus Moranbacteria bacterium]|nr:hypothetical protein [Candidatus Moranbacteria bacterium]